MFYKKKEERYFATHEDIQYIFDLLMKEWIENQTIDEAEKESEERHNEGYHVLYVCIYKTLRCPPT